MGAELPSLGANQVIVSLPDLGTDELLPICELLCQEGFPAWSVSAQQVGELPGLLSVFGRRARIGVHGVATASEVKAAAAAGASFAGSAFCLPKLVKAVSGFPVVLGGFTPTELLAGLDAGAAAVQVIPGDAFAPFQLGFLSTLLGEGELIAGGRLYPELAADWRSEGVAVVWPQELFDPELASQSSLEPLREAVQAWRLEQWAPID